MSLEICATAKPSAEQIGKIMPKTIWLVTHAETVLRNPPPYGAWVPDPEMSSNGLEEVARLRPVLDTYLCGTTPPEIHCGTGRRQWQTACALGFSNPEMAYFSALWGDASTLAKCDDRRMVLLCHGLLIPYDQYRTAEHIGGSTIRGVIASLPSNSVICSGRPVLIRLGMKLEECQSGALYSLHPRENGDIDIALVKGGKIL